MSETKLKMSEVIILYSEVGFLMNLLF
jgi:hypothetical protein